MPDWKVCKMRKLGDRSFTENKRIYILKIAQRRANFALSYTIYLEIGLSTSKCPQKHGGFDVTGVQLGYAVNAVYH